MLIITWLLHCILIIGNVTLYHNFSQIHLSFPSSSKLLKHLYFTESSYTTLVVSIFLNTFSSLKCSSLGNFMHEYPLVISFLDLCILFTHVGIHSPNSWSEMLCVNCEAKRSMLALLEGQSRRKLVQFTSFWCRAAGRNRIHLVHLVQYSESLCSLFQSHFLCIFIIKTICSSHNTSRFI